MRNLLCNPSGAAVIELYHARMQKSMMPPPLAADDVSADAEMMLFAIAHNDAMFALTCPQAHIISEAASCAKRTSFARLRAARGDSVKYRAFARCEVFAFGKREVLRLCRKVKLSVPLISCRRHTSRAKRTSRPKDTSRSAQRNT